MIAFKIKQLTMNNNSASEFEFLSKNINITDATGMTWTPMFMYN